jgi:hypothetical protein
MVIDWPRAGALASAAAVKKFVTLVDQQSEEDSSEHPSQLEAKVDILRLRNLQHRFLFMLIPKNCLLFYAGTDTKLHI